MPIECVWFDEQGGPEGPWEPGWCFPLGYDLSKHFLANVAQHRRPISVVVPCRDGRGTAFCIDSHPTDKPDEAWTVTITGPLVVGQKPPITVAPSIHAIGLYHGFLHDGVLTDDIGG